jgi:hypothetical protein
MRLPRRTLAAVLPALALAATAAAAPAQRGQVVVDAAAVRGLETRLDSLAATLPAEQRQLLTDLLLRAAAAPADNPAGTTVRPVFYSPGGRGIIVQGGRTAIVVQGGRAAAGTATPRPADPNAPRPGSGAVAIGPKQDDPRAPGTGAVAIGPKQDDPGAPRPGNGAVAIGPKQDDPGAPRPTNILAIGPKQDDPRSPQGALVARLTELGATLPAAQRGALDWMLQRAAGSPGTPGSPGGLPPGRKPSLAQSLGILAIGPKQDDPAPPPPANTRWVLQF